MQRFACVVRNNQPCTCATCWRAEHQRFIAIAQGCACADCVTAQRAINAIRREHWWPRERFPGWLALPWYLPTVQKKAVVEPWEQAQGRRRP